MIDAVLASLVKIEIYSGGMVEIKGLDTITPQHSTTDADMSTRTSVDADGNQVERQLPARRARSWQLEGKYLVDTDSGERDPGQAAVEEFGVKTGTAAITQFRFTPAGGTPETFLGTVVLGDLGGGDKDSPADFKATIRYYGEVE